MTERRLLSTCCGDSSAAHGPLVASGPTWYQKSELQDKLKHNPYSYIQVINPDTSRAWTFLGAASVFDEVRAGRNFKSRGWLEKAPEQEWYVYRQTTASHSWTGVVCNLDLAACADGGLKTHEQTLEVRETLFATFLEQVGFHAEPILCAQPDGAPGALQAREALAAVVTDTSHTDFMTADGVRHEIWRVGAESALGRTMAATWGELTTLYLADGHHRLSSSQRLAQARPDWEGARDILAFVVPEEDLTILGYHKEVRGLTWSAEACDALLDKADGFTAESTEPTATPQRPGEAVVHFKGLTWLLRRNAQCQAPSDADWIQTFLLEGQLGIRDARNDARLRHLPEPQSPDAGWCERASASDRMLILLHPFHWAHPKGRRRQGTLPPKTWVEPKIAAPCSSMNSRVANALLQGRLSEASAGRRGSRRGRRILGRCQQDQTRRGCDGRVRRRTAGLWREPGPRIGGKSPTSSKTSVGT